MADHIAVRKIDAQEIEIAGAELVDEHVGNLCALHPRALFKGNNIGRNFDVFFKLIGELAASVSVPEVCHMTEFLRFAYRELSVTVIYEEFAHRTGNFGR